MKKLLSLTFTGLVAMSLSAQSQTQLEPSEVYQEKQAPSRGLQFQAESSSQTVIWSEDFSAGIPTTWSQNGSPALALWEYRGPNTAPPDTVGSIGCWAGPNQSGNLGAPINSPTRSNGFVIFDSDFLHSNGDRATNGQGTVPAPHVGRLRTDTIDLSNHGGAELTFYSYARRFQAAWYVAISVDGGITFPDTVEVFPASELPVNSSTDRDAFFQANISNVVANQAHVVLEFIFDGTVSNSNGSGRYYWMIDDIALVTPPENLLLFTRATAPGTSGEAPAHDILFDNNSAYPKYMHLAAKQQVPITFDSNILNYGTNTQTNVGLAVEILDSNENVVSTILSPTVASLAPFDTAYYTTLTTPAWTAPFDGDFKIVYKAFSDSITVAATPTADTFSLSVDEEYAIDDDEVSNYFGTNTGTNGMIAIGVMFNLEDPDPAGTNSEVYLQGVDALMSCLTDSTADMEIAIWDTAGFVFNSGFPPGSQPIYRQVFSFDGSIPCNLANFSFEDAMGRPLAIPAGTYYIVASLFPNAAAGVIRFANSANWNQPSYASIFQNQNGSWFSGFSNSTTFEAPHFRLKVADPSDISLVERDMGDFMLYPNPTTGKGTIQFDQAGQYSLSITTLSGVELLREEIVVNGNKLHQLDLRHLASGVYLVNIFSPDQGQKSVKITIQH